MRYYCLDKLINLHDDYRKAIKIDEHNLLLIQSKGERYLLRNTCPHRGYPLIKAELADDVMRCPLHGYSFSLTSGDLVYASDEPCKGLQLYDLVYHHTEIGVML